jgi:hypothetical protein
MIRGGYAATQTVAEGEDLSACQLLMLFSCTFLKSQNETLIRSSNSLPQNACNTEN